MNRLAWLGLYVTASLGCLAGEARADAAGDFQELFGKEAQKVAATRGTEDDAALAATLLKAARALRDRTDLQVLLWEKAAEFGGRDLAGCQTAVQALRRLMQAVPDRQADWREKLLAVCEFRYKRSPRADRAKAGEALIDQVLLAADAAVSAGQADAATALFRKALFLAGSIKSPRREDISEHFQRAAARLAVERKRKALHARLREDPTDTTARETLIRLVLLERGEPAEAAKLVTQDVSEVLRTYVPLAARPVEGIADAACLELAAWYEKLSQAATPVGRATALRRASYYYQRHLIVHRANDVPRLKARMALEKVEKRRAGLPLARVWPAGRRKALDLGKGVTIDLVLMPAGTFLMGSGPPEKDRRNHEGPRHRVILSRPFYLGVTEVTQGQYEAVLDENPSAFRGEDRPVEQVSWEDAVAFCEALSASTGHTVRLPTEAEWEYACRAGTDTPYSFGADAKLLAAHGRYKRNGRFRTHPVGGKEPNPAGLYDVHGNVSEWCADRYSEGYYAASGDVDPPGAATGGSRVRRGGSAWQVAATCRSAAREAGGADSKSPRVGFRIVVEPGAPTTRPATRPTTRRARPTTRRAN